MCRWFAYISSTEECLLEDVLVSKSCHFRLLEPPAKPIFTAPSHALTKQVQSHYLPKLFSHNPADHAGHTTEAEVSARNRLFNVDGFGMAWYTPDFSLFETDEPCDSPSLHPALYKNTQPPLHDWNFRSICANTASKAVFAHVRAATSTAVTPVNSHPFVFGQYSSMRKSRDVVKDIPTRYLDYLWTS